jgi:endonuclease/exonuclease/phosphatase family metal-dependent hydrolase
VKVIICGDFNVNYMENSNKKAKLEEILNTFNLKSIISFPTRIGSKSATIIDNIFIDELQFNGYEVISVANGLSDHEAQLLSILLSQLCTGKNDAQFGRNINDYNKTAFNMKLT